MRCPLSLCPLLSLTAFPLAVLALVGCGDLIPDHGSCDGRPAEQVCEDLLSNRNNHFRQTFESLCSLGDGTYSDDFCDTAGTLGGCRCDGCENGETITWYFAGADDGAINTAEDVQARCEELSRAYVIP